MYKLTNRQLKKNLKKNKKDIQTKKNYNRHTKNMIFLTKRKKIKDDYFFFVYLVVY